jgi:hypothetical protein
MSESPEPFDSPKMTSLANKLHLAPKKQNQSKHSPSQHSLLHQSSESHASCGHAGFLWTNKPTPLGHLDRHHSGTVKRTKHRGGGKVRSLGFANSDSTEPTNVLTFVSSGNHDMSTSHWTERVRPPPSFELRWWVAENSTGPDGKAQGYQGKPS